MLGGMVGTTVEQGPTRVEARADLRGTVQRTYVDYTLGAGHRRPGAPAACARTWPPWAAGRCGIWAWTGRATAAARPGFAATAAWVSTAAAGAIELFVAVERRIDPYQLEFGTATWASVGMRLLSR